MINVLTTSRRHPGFTCKLAEKRGAFALITRWRKDGAVSSCQSCFVTTVGRCDFLDNKTLLLPVSSEAGDGIGVDTALEMIEDRGADVEMVEAQGVMVEVGERELSSGPEAESIGDRHSRAGRSKGKGKSNPTPSPVRTLIATKRGHPTDLSPSKAPKSARKVPEASAGSLSVNPAPETIVNDPVPPSATSLSQPEDAGLWLKRQRQRGTVRPVVSVRPAHTSPPGLRFVPSDDFSTASATLQLQTFQTAEPLAQVPYPSPASPTPLAKTILQAETAVEALFTSSDISLVSTLAKFRSARQQIREHLLQGFEELRAANDAQLQAEASQIQATKANLLQHRQATIIEQRCSDLSDQNRALLAKNAFLAAEIQQEKDTFMAAETKLKEAKAVSELRQDLAVKERFEAVSRAERCDLEVEQMIREHTEAQSVVERALNELAEEKELSGRAIAEMEVKHRGAIEVMEAKHLRVVEALQIELDSLRGGPNQIQASLNSGESSHSTRAPSCPPGPILLPLGQTSPGESEDIHVVASPIHNDL